MIFENRQSSINTPLYPHQVDFVKWGIKQSQNNQGFILGDIQGLGKTRECCYLMGCMSNKMNLIITPKSTIFQWAREVQESFPEANIYIGSKHRVERVSIVNNKVTLSEKYHMDILLNENDKPTVMIVTPFACVPYPELTSTEEITAKEKELSQPLDIYMSELTPFNKIKWDMVICDEAHTLRNGLNISDDKNKRPKSLKYHRISRIRMTPNGIRIACTGTPIQNRKTDIVSLFKWVGVKLPTKIDDCWIQDMVKTIVFRRTQSNLHPTLFDIIKFPKKLPTIENIYVKYKTDDEKQFYELVTGTITKKHKQKNKFNNIQYIANPLVRINMLRYLSSSIDMFIRIHNNIFEHNQIEKWNGSETKIEMIGSQLKTLANENKSVIIFIHYYDEMNRIKNELNKYDELYGSNLGYKIYKLNGESSITERDSTIHGTKYDIENGERCIIFANILSSAEGLNLQHFNIAIFATPDWNPKLEEQAISRIDRIGQTKEVFIYKYYHETIEEVIEIEGIRNQITINDIDRYIEQTQHKKLSIFDDVFYNTLNAAYYAERMIMNNSNSPAVQFNIDDTFICNKHCMREKYINNPTPIQMAHNHKPTKIINDIIIEPRTT